MHAPFTRERIAEAAKTQIEYYMSEENLHKDQYVRGKMDKDGWIPLALIMTFHMCDLFSLLFGSGIHGTRLCL